MLFRAHGRTLFRRSVNRGRLKHYNILLYTYTYRCFNYYCFRIGVAQYSYTERAAIQLLYYIQVYKWSYLYVQIALQYNTLCRIVSPIPHGSARRTYTHVYCNSVVRVKLVVSNSVLLLLCCERVKRQCVYRHQADPAVHHHRSYCSAFNNESRMRPRIIIIVCVMNECEIGSGIIIIQYTFRIGAHCASARLRLGSSTSFFKI